MNDFAYLPTIIDINHSYLKILEKAQIAHKK